MRYEIELKDQAMIDLAKLAKNEPKSFLKVQSLIEELREHPLQAQASPNNCQAIGRGSGVVVLHKNTVLFMKSMTMRS